MRKQNKQSLVRPLLMLVFLVAFTRSPAPVTAQRRATLVPPPGTWLLDLQLHGNPQKINVTLPGEKKPRTYWYLLYTVTNNTGQDVNFYPQIDLFTDTFLVYRAENNVRRVVFEAIRKRYATTIPLLEPQNRVTGRLLVGEDNARDSVAIFEDFDPKSNAVKIFIGGLSSEIVKIKTPTILNTQPDKPQETLLRRSLMLEYQVPGDSLNPSARVMLYQKRSWVLR
ncbi:hypothetical protein ACFL02_03080 [Planctomycetota bacterium]